jgi:TonB family protein
MTVQSSVDGGDLNFFPLVRSPFLLSSILFHGLLLLLVMRATTMTIVKPPSETPISVQLLEPRDGGSSNRSIGPGLGPGGPRTMPKLGTPAMPAERRGSMDSGSLKSSVPAPRPVEPESPRDPAPMTGPKVLADTRAESVNIKETSPDSLVRLPTKEAPTQLAGNAAADLEAHQKSLSSLKSTGEPAGIRALKDGTQIPGALKGSGSGLGPMGVPGGSATGTGMSGGGTGTGTGGGSATGLRGLSAADYNRYLNQLKRRVESVWKYPDGVSGVQQVAILFTIDRAGRLMQSEVLESTDARLNASAVEAMKRAAPFAPIPENLKDLANTPLRMQFTVTIGVRG